MKIFVTGATGFIGRHLVRRLVSEGHSVRCLVRKTSRRCVLEGIDVAYVTGDVLDRQALSAGMSGCDWVFHLANLYSMWEPDASRFYQVNVEGTRCVFDYALQQKVGKVLYVSTVATFGTPAQAPFNEQALPGAKLYSEYARTKAEADRLAWNEYYPHGLPLVAFYPAIVLGEGDNKASGQYIRDIVRRRVPSTIFHDSISTYVSVHDVVDALLCAAALPDTVGKKYLVGKSTLSGKDFAKMIHEVSGAPLPLLHFPDWMVISAAYLLTMLAGVIHRPPLWGLSVDAAWTLKHGFQCDGSKAERELGMRYSPIQTAIAEAIRSYGIEKDPGTPSYPGSSIKL